MKYSSICSAIDKMIKKPSLAWSIVKRFILCCYRKGFYGSINPRVVICDARLIKNKKHIFFNGSAIIMPYCRIEPVLKYEGCNYSPSVIIGNQVSINQSLHLTCANRISIGDYTNIAAFVTVTDISHPYEDISIPIKKAKLVIGEVTIGEGCEIYNGAVILPNVHIGNHCVIGANSVVTKDIPDYCVAVGAPARVIKRFDFESGKWVKAYEN